MLYEAVKTLCDKKGISIQSLETELAFGRRTIYKWKTIKPSVDKVKRVADYFNVTVDYLLSNAINERGRHHASTSKNRR